MEKTKDFCQCFCMWNVTKCDVMQNSTSQSLDMMCISFPVFVFFFIITQTHFFTSPTASSVVGWESKRLVCLNTLITIKEDYGEIQIANLSSEDVFLAPGTHGNQHGGRYGLWLLFQNDRNSRDQSVASTWLLWVRKQPPPPQTHLQNSKGSDQERQDLEILLLNYIIINV